MVEKGVKKGELSGFEDFFVGAGGAADGAAAVEV